MKSLIQHYGNELHIYCRLCKIVNRKLARKISKIAGRFVRFLAYSKPIAYNAFN